MKSELFLLLLLGAGARGEIIVTVTGLCMEDLGERRAPCREKRVAPRNLVGFADYVSGNSDPMVRVAIDGSGKQQTSEGDGNCKPIINRNRNHFSLRLTLPTRAIR